ncbi:hypothetical protein E3N88_32161 [Mikania micrantha]|uniref:Uncharacterized protein n=1 Tax=Mikania micrantha TaxID=192012 RepID=A0A5N6M875_9ASTR|nr:hypothetical protein E3N88_32161 [Mikania micrantha]
MLSSHGGHMVEGMTEGARLEMMFSETSPRMGPWPNEDRLEMVLEGVGFEGLLPRDSVKLGLDLLYFCVEGIKSYVWAKESLDFVKKRVRYKLWKFENGGFSQNRDFRV